MDHHNDGNHAVELLRLRHLRFGSLAAITVWSAVALWLVIGVIYLSALALGAGTVAINGNLVEGPVWNKVLAGGFVVLIMMGVASILAVIGAGLLRLFRFILPLGRADFDHQDDFLVTRRKP
jgi:hypothetical protein